MTLGLNLLPLTPGEQGGGETYMRELALGLTKVTSPEQRVVLFTRRDSGVQRWDTGSAEIVEVPNISRSRLERVAWEQLVLPLLLRHHGVDAVVMPANAALLMAPARQVGVLHDLSPFFYQRTFPGLIPRRKQWYNLTSVRVLLRRCDTVLVPSQFVRDEVERVFPHAQDAIRVVPYAGWSRAARSGRAHHGADDAGLSIVTGRYALCVAFKSKHKNLERLVRAWSALPDDVRSERRLVLVGRPGYGYEDLQEQIGACPPSGVVLVDHFIEASVLEQLYRGAELFVLPSLYEGWGIPVLEAMAHGVPVASSSAASLPEVVGDAALLFDPLQVSEITEAMRLLLTDATRRAVLVSRGTARAAEFSWEETARRVLAAAFDRPDG